MIKVTIKNLQGVETNGAIFLDTDELNKWIREQRNRLAFGLIEGWYGEHLLTLEQRSLATETKNEDELGNRLPEKLYYILDQFVVETIDITNEISFQNKVIEGKKRIALGDLVLSYVYAFNDSKNLTEAQFIAILADETLAQIERLLKNGSLGLAKSMISQLDTTYFTSDEKNQILTLLGDY